MADHGRPPVSEGEVLEYDREDLVWIAIALFVVSGGIGTTAFVWVHGTAAPVRGGGWTVGSIVVVGIVTMAVTIALHEAMHALVGWGLGYSVRVGIRPDRTAFYTVAPDQYWEPSHLATAAIAPLVVIGIVTLGLIVTAPQLIAVAAVLAFVTNAVGAAGDLLVCWRTLTVDASTRFYDAGDGMTFVVECGDED